MYVCMYDFIYCLLLSTFPLQQATSSLDTETEQSVQESLQLLGGQNRTLVVIAHRLSTIQDADCICVLEQGRLVETGTHTELLSRSNGRYAELVMKMQQQAATVEVEGENKDNTDNESSSSGSTTNSSGSTDANPSKK